MTTVVAAANTGQPLPNGWPLPCVSVRVASRAEFRQLLAREEAGAAQEGASVAERAALGAAARPRPPTPAAGKPAPTHAFAPQPSTDDDLLDPLHRHRAALAPPDTTSTPPSFALPVPISTGFAPAAVVVPEAAPRALASLEHLVPALVRRIAWSGDARRGTARLEIGAGELAGSTLLVHADDGQVRVQLSVPAGIDAVSWQRRIAVRLASRNIATESVEVA